MINRGTYHIVHYHAQYFTKRVEGRKEEFIRSVCGKDYLDIAIILAIYLLRILIGTTIGAMIALELSHGLKMRERFG